MNTVCENNDYHNWASRWDAIEAELRNIQATKKALCQEIRTAKGRQTLDAFKQAMRILNSAEDKLADREAIDKQANEIVNAVRAAVAEGGPSDTMTPNDRSGAAVVDEPEALTESAEVESVGNPAYSNRANETTDDPKVEHVAMATRTDIEEALADLPTFDDNDVYADKEIVVPLHDSPDWQEEVVLDHDPSMPEAEFPSPGRNSSSSHEHDWDLELADV